MPITPDPLPAPTAASATHLVWIEGTIVKIVAYINALEIPTPETVALQSIATDLRYQTNEIRRAKGEPTL